MGVVRKVTGAMAVAAVAVTLVPWGSGVVDSITPPAVPEQVGGAVNLVFSRGGTPARYPANSVVRVDAGNINFVKGCLPGPGGRGFPDFVQASADLYIVPSGRDFNQADPLSDVLGAPNTVWAGLGGSFLYQPLALTGAAGRSTGLPSGTYDVIVDECQNQMWDTGQDSIVRDAFVVDLDQEVPGFDYEVQEFLALKARAGERLEAGAQIESVLNQILVLELAAQVQSIADATKGVADFATFVAKMFVPELDPPAALRGWGRAIVLNSVEKRRAALINLRDDPPDPDFQRFANPVRFSPTASAPIPELDETFAVLAVNEAIAATEAAFVRALERYQGAEQAGNVAWAARHARTLDELATLHTELTATLPGLVAPVVDHYTTAGDPVAQQNVFVNMVRNQIVPWGRDGYERNTSWWNTALSVEETIAATTAFRDEIATTSPWGIDAAVFVVPALTTSADGDAAFSTELRAWVDAAVPTVLAELDAVTNPIAADPEVGIAPVTGASSGADVVLAVELPADYVPDSVRWDLDGDGEFDDATGATPTWTVPGDVRAGVPYVIAVEVLGGLTADTAYEVVVPVAGNLPPTVTVVAPLPTNATAGTTATLEVATSDPEGGPVSVEWFVDGAPTGQTGPTLDIAIPSGFFGQYDAVAVAIDQAGASRSAGITLEVRPFVDDDNDGVLVGPDCDDGARFVSPTAFEQVGNGIDDDCDPSTPDTGSPISVGSPDETVFQSVEGDVYEFVNSSWGHPSRFSGDPFTIEVEWGDGTTSTQTVSGTSLAETTFVLSHRYTDELPAADLRWCISNASDPEGCGQRLDTIRIANEAPFVGAADLRSWIEEDSSLDPEQCAGPPACDGQTPTGNGAEWIVDEEGRWARATTNAGDYLALHSPIALAEGGYGRAAVELSVTDGGDNDNMGFALGFDAGDLLAPTGTEDFVDFEWTGRARMRQTGENPISPLECRNSNASDQSGADGFADTATISRTRGPVVPHERNYNVTLDLVDPNGGPVNPLCQDGFGVDELLVLDLDQNDLDANSSGAWLRRAIDPNTVAAPPFGPIGSPYHFTVDYRPDRLRVWSGNGSLIADLAPRDAANDPFPPGGLAVFRWSQSGVRAKGTAPEIVIDVVQGSEGAITMPFTDGGDDEWVATVNWGDGSSQSVGAISESAIGAGWYDVTATHTYLRAGAFRGEVCVLDDLDDGSCFTFRANVQNLPPVVEAGPDIAAEPDLVSGATLSLEQATFTDPGTADDHTATVDWGDGTVEPATVVSTRSTGGVVTGTHTYAADGTYQVEVCVTDQAGATGCDTLDVDVRVGNQPPVAAVEVPDDPEGAGDPVLLGGGFTDPNPDDVHTMTIDPGDGTGPLSVPVRQGRGVGMSGLEHVYAAAGTFTVTSCVIDSDGATDCASASFEAVADATPNRSPVADAGGPYTVDEGSSVSLDASGSSDPDGDPLTVAWDLDGDGSYETVGVSPPFEGGDGPSDVAVEVRVCDAEPSCATAEAQIRVRSVAPTIERFEVVVLGTEVEATVEYTDPAADDIHVVAIDWGDGSPVGTAALVSSGDDLFAVAAMSGGTVGASHVYEPGTWTVTATVTDDDGATGSATRTAVVTAPTSGGGAPDPVDPGPTAPPPPVPSPTGSLPATGGGGSGPVIVLGATSLVAVGIGLLLLRRRRRWSW